MFSLIRSPPPQGGHYHQITAWKRQLLDAASDAFAAGAGHRGDESEAKIDTLHAKISELTMERDFLDRGLDRFDPK